MGILIYTTISFKDCRRVGNLLDCLHRVLAQMVSAFGFEPKDISSILVRPVCCNSIINYNRGITIFS